MRHRNGAIVIMFLIGLILLIGCARKEKIGKNNIYFANWESRPEQVVLWKEVIDTFNNAHPDIYVRYDFVPGGTQPLIVRIAGGKSPDVFYWGTSLLSPLVEKDVLLELTTFIERDRINPEKFFPSTWGGAILKEKIYGLPINWAGYEVIGYNKGIFDQEKVPYPEAGWNWEDYLEIAKRLTKREKSQFGSIPLGAWNMVYAFGGSWFDEEGNFTLDTPEAKKAFTFVQDLRHKYKVTPGETLLGPGGASHPIQLFMSGKVAMLPAPAYALTSFKDIKDFSWDVVSSPSEAGVEKKVMEDSGLLVISTQSKYPEASWEFVKYSCYEKGAEILAKGKNAVPSLKENAKKHFTPPPENISLYYNQENVKVVFSPGKLPFYSEWEITVRDPEIEKLNLNMQTPGETIQNLKRKTEQLLSERRKMK